MFDYYESHCFSRLGCLITTNVQNVFPERPDNELIGCKNLRMPSYCIPVVYILSHQLFSDKNYQNR